MIMRGVQIRWLNRGKIKLLQDQGGILDRHDSKLRNRIGGGKTPVQFRRFSSSTPARLAEGLGPIRLPLANWRCAPKTWVPRSRKFSGLGSFIDRLLEYNCQAPLRNCVVFLRHQSTFGKIEGSVQPNSTNHLNPYISVRRERLLTRAKVTWD